MDTIYNFSCGGDSVVLLGGVDTAFENTTAAEILKGEPLEVQPAFLKNTQIKMPTLNMAGAAFSADAALCAAAILTEPGEAVSLTSNALGTPFFLHFAPEKQLAEISFAAKAQIKRTAPLPSVLFGGCEYFIAELMPENAPQFTARLCENSTAPCAALLVKTEDKIVPFFCEKGEPCRAFSAGSAAVALAFFESESERNFFEKTYLFPKGERHIRLKRFLSEMFDCTLRAVVIPR